VDGADVDDAAVEVGVAEAADEGLSEEEGALEVDVEDGVVVLFGDVTEGASISMPALLTRMSQRRSCL
jgi:hypothetical protein